MSSLATDSSSESPPEIEVPAEIRRTSAGATHTTGCLLSAILLLIPAFVYFGFFGVILLDELVLNTRFLSSDSIPPQVIDGLEIIYWPLILLVRWALGM